MTTSNDLHPPTISSPGPLRLRLAEPDPSSSLDGGWWPRSRDLTVELPDLIANFPQENGRIVRALVSPPDWDDSPRRIPLRRGGIAKVGSFPRDDTHVVHLNTAGHKVVVLLVVPPGSDDAQGAALLEAAGTGNRTKAVKLLEAGLRA
jgi:hypothetical protein